MGPRVPTRGPARGFSLVESLVVLALATSVLVAALPVFAGLADTADAAAAARYLATRLAAARADASRRQRTVALRVTTAPAAAVETFVDGDGDGISAADIAAGIDARIAGPDLLAVHFPRVRLAIAADVPAIDDGPALHAGDDPVRLGTTDQISVSPLGTSTSGTVYLASRYGVQFAVRVAGVTGRARVFRFDAGARAWRPY